MKKDDVIVCLIVLGIGATIGALTGLALSFTTLSPLVMGGIVAAVPALLHFSICTGEGLSQSQFSYAHACLFVASAATGVSLAAAATAISPSIMLGMGSAALAGAIIAPIAVIAGFLVAFGIIEPIAKKVNEYIISPIVERFSSKGEEKAI
ncbi:MULTISPECIES: hypothetical protein [unclassified Wolbachia]|uniref:hypothetical protein n=1 Tax=unclassified Wolbachia TaxID=2640676 RepID=UPI002231E47D|nr:hypothetical protein [Wolbachia endosymbiont (group B) of Emmelina monodactyla]